MSVDVERSLEALRADPSNQDAFNAIAGAAGSTPRALLVEAYRLRASVVDDELACRLLLSVAPSGATDPTTASLVADAVARAARAPGVLRRIEQIAQNQGDVALQGAVILHRADAAGASAFEREAALRTVLSLASDGSEIGLAVSAWERLATLAPNLADEAAGELSALADGAVARPDLLARIEQAVRRLGDRRALVHVLNTRFSTANVESDTASLGAELAVLALEVTRDPSIALDYLTRAHRRAPSQAAALREAAASVSARLPRPDLDLLGFERQLAEQTGDWVSAARLATAGARVASSGDERADLLIHAADLHAGRLDEVEVAVGLYSEASATAPSRRALVEDRLGQLRRAKDGSHGAVLRQAQVELLERAGDWAGLADVLRAESASATGALRAERLVQLGRLERDRLERPGSALRTLLRAARETGTPAVASEAIETGFALLSDARVRLDAASELETYLGETERWDDLVRLRRRQIESSVSVQERAHFHAQLGTLLSERLGQHAAAADELERACELQPGSARLYDQARTARLDAGQPDEALRLIAREYRETDSGDRRSELDCHRAAIYADHKQNLRLALDSVFTALEEHEDDPRLAATFARLLTGENGSGAVEQLMSQLLDRGDRQQAQALAWLAGRTLGFESDAGAAFGLRATELASLDPLRLLQLQAAVDSRGRPDERLRVHRLLAESAPSSEARAAARYVAADLLAQAGRHAEAIALLEDLIERDAENETYQLRRIEVMTAQGSWSALIEASERALATLPLDEDRAAALLRTIARTAEGELGNPDRAAMAWRRLLDLLPGDTEASDWLRRDLDRSGDLRAYFDAVAATIPDLTSRTQADARHLELAQFAEDRLADSDAAVPHWAAVATSQGLDVVARRRAYHSLTEYALRRKAYDEAVAALGDELALADGPEAKLERCEAVLEVLLDARATALAFEVAQMGLRAEGSPSAWFLDQTASVALRLQAVPVALAAFEAWHRSPETMPADRLALYAATALGASDESAWDLVEKAAAHDAMTHELYDAVLRTGSSDGAARAARAILARADSLEGDDAITQRYLASGLLAHSGHSAAAVEVWRSIVATDPTQVEALEALRDDAIARDDMPAFRDWLDEGIAALDGSARALALHQFRVATAPDDASRAADLRRLADVDARDIAARESLATWYRRTEEWGPLAEVLTELAALEPDAARQKAHRFALSRVAGQQLGDPLRAIAALEAICSDEPGEFAALERLEKLYRQIDDAAGLASTLDRLTAVAPNDDRRVELLRALSSVCETRLHDLPRAVGALKRVLAIEPANLAVLEDQARLYAAQSDWTSHLAVLETLAGATSIVDLRAEVFVRAARVLHEHAQRSREAVDLLAQALASREADDETLDLLRTAAEACGAWIELAGILKQVSERERVPSRRAKLQAEVGRVLDEKAEEPGLALDFLKAAFHASPGSGPVLDALEQIAAHRDARTQLVDVYKALAQPEDGDAETAWRALVGSANVAEHEVNRPDMAFDIFARAAGRSGMRERAEAEMTRLAAAHVLWVKWSDYLASRDDELRGDDLLANVLRRAASEEDDLGDWQRAFETLVSYFSEFENDPQMTDALYGLARRRGGWDLVVRLFEYLQTEAADDTARVGYLREMSRICAEEQQNPDGAFTQWLRAWQLSPADESLRAGLSERAEAAGRGVDLLAAWEWEARREADPELREAPLRRVLGLAAELGLADRFIAAFADLVVLPGRAPAVVDEFAPVAATLGADAAFIDAIDAGLPRLATGESRASTALRLAELAPGCGRTAVAAAALRRTLGTSQRQDDLRRALIRLDRAANDLGALATDIADLLHAVESVDERLTLGREMIAALLETGAGDRAVAAAIRLLSQAPDHAETFAYVAECLTTAERWDELAEAHLDRAQRVEQTAARDHLLAAAAIVDEQLRDPGRTLRVLEPLLALHADDTEALSARGRALASMGRWNDYVDTMRQIAASSSGHVAASALGDAASVVELQLLDIGRAQQLWHEATAADATWYRAPAEESRLATERSDHTVAVRTSDEALRRAEAAGVSGRELADLLVARTRLMLATGAPEAAAEAGERAVSTDPAHPDARAAWERALEATGGIERLIELTDSAIQAATEDEVRATLLVRRAQLCAIDAGRDADGRRAAERAQQLASSAAGPHLVLGDIHLHANRPTEAVVAYERAFDGETLLNVALLPAHRVLLAGEREGTAPQLVWGTRLGAALARAGRLDEAIDRLETVTLEDDRYLPALVELVGVLRDRGALSATRVHLPLILASGASLPPAVFREMRELAARAAEADGDTVRAAQLYAELSRDGEGDVAAVRRAVRLSLQSGATATVAANLEQLAQLSTNPEERAVALTSLATLELENPDETLRAITRFEEALVIAPPGSRAIETAAAGLAGVADASLALEALGRVLDSAPADARRAAVLLARAEVHERVDGPTSEAASQDCADALLAAPDSATALERVVQSFGTRVDARGLSAAIERALNVLHPTQLGARADLLRALASTQRDGLGDKTALVITLEELARLVPDDTDLLRELLVAYDALDSDDHDADALSVASTLAERGVLDQGLLRTLERLHYGHDDVDAVLQVLQVLRIAGEASGAEIQLLESLPSTVPALGAGSLDRDFVANAFAWDGPAEATQALVRASGERFVAASAGATVGGEEVDLVSLAAREHAVLSAAFGTESVLRVDDDIDAIRIMAGSPTALILPRRIAESNDRAAVRFELAVALTMAQPEYIAASVLSAFEFMAWFEATIDPLCSSRPPLDASIQRRIDGYRLRIGALPTPADSARGPRESFWSAAEYREYALKVAVRAGVLASFDSRTALRLVLDQVEEPMPVGLDELRSVCERVPAARALIAYVLSARYLSARRSLGLVLGRR